MKVKKAVDSGRICSDDPRGEKAREGPLDTERAMAETITNCIDYMPMYTGTPDEDPGEVMCFKDAGNQMMREHMCELILKIRPAVAAGELLAADLVSLVMQAQDWIAPQYPTMRNAPTREACLITLCAAGLLDSGDLHKMFLE